MSRFNPTTRSRSHAYLPQHTTIDSIGPTRSTGRLRTTSAMNLPGLSEHRTFHSKRSPKKSTSFQVSRDGSGTPLLPKYATEPIQRTSSSTHKFKASESGRGDLLPRCSPSPQQGYSSDSVWGKSGSSTLESIKNIGQRLRSRRRTSSTESTQWDQNRFERSGSFEQYIPGAGKAKLHFNRTYPARKREWLQLLIVSIVVLLVTDSYRKAVMTTERLEHFQSEESMMMLHLQRIEQQWINLHERMSRFTSSNDRIDTGLQPVEIRAPEVVDSELIRVQTQQLYQMEEELDMELKSLQTKLQNVARASIVRTYGEGPVQVIFDLDFPEGIPAGQASSISILLWYDTPHAAWTWLQQIQRGEWNGAMFEIGQSATIDAAPLLKNSGTLDFVEKSQKHHEAWTVGLTDNGGGLGMFINLQDNTEAKYHDVCVGKVIDGFDALQRLVDTTRHGQQNSVVIRQATSTHLTRQRPV